MAKVLRAVLLLLPLMLLAGVPAVVSADTESRDGGPEIAGQQAGPRVSLAATANVEVRLNSPVSITATFSEPVSGFTLGDITVANGTASNLSGRDGDEVYTFNVTPNAVGQVTVDIAAGVATDGEGNRNTAAPRLSLGIPYDLDRSGGISRSEVIAAIIDYFAGGINRAQTIELIVLYFASPAEPEPGPGISDDCIQTVSSDGTINGQWASGCDSETRSGSHARYYTITLDAYSEVTVRLESSAANTHLYLRRGDATSGTALHENDDHGGSTSVSQIQETLAAGSYTIEATTYSAGSTGSFTLTISGQSGAMPRDPALLRYAADNAGGPGAIYVGDINQLVGPAPGDSGSSSLGDDDGMVPLDALQDHLWLYESSYYHSLLDRANLTDPTPLSSTGESIVIQHACINRSLLPCRLIELYWAPNLEARTNGQLKLDVSSYPELGLAGPNTLQLVSDGTLSMAGIYPGYVAWQLPAMEVQSLWGIYPDSATMYLSLTDMHPQLEAMVAEATGGGIIVNHNWYSGNDQFLFSKKALRTLADFEGLKTRSHSQALSDWIRGMGAEAQFVSFAEVYASLQRGILHAGVTGATPGYGQRWYEVTDYLNGPLRSMPSTNNVINADVWNDIPADLQQIFIEEGAKAELEQLRLTSIQNVIGVQRIIDAGMRLVEFSPELLDHSFDVAVIEHVIPGWLNRMGYPGEGDNAVAMFNEHVGPYVGLHIESDGSVAQVPISQGPHTEITDGPGTVTLSSLQPLVGIGIKAVLADSDGSVSGITWRWETSPDGMSGWAVIEGATSDSYTPVAGDLRKYLRATVEYADGNGTGKSAQAVSGRPVADINTPTQYAADNAGGPGAIYVGDIRQLVGPAPSDSDRYFPGPWGADLGDDDGTVPLDALRDHLWLYESSYYRSLLDRANLTNPTPLTSTGESIEVQYACVNRALPPCRLIELYWAPNLEARSNGQLKLDVSSYPELGLAGRDALQHVSDGTLAMADIYHGYHTGELPAFEVQSLWGIYPDWVTTYLSQTDMHPQLEAMVAEATGGGIIVNHNWYSGDDQYLFSRDPLRTLADFEGLRTRSHSSSLSDWIRGMGAEPQFMAFAEVFTALERGRLDAGVTSARAGYSQRWYEVTGYLNGPLRSMLSSNNVINADVWNDIPADLQQIFIEEGAKAELEQLRLTPIQNVIYVQRLDIRRYNIHIREEGLTLVEFSQELLDHSFDVAVIEHVIPGWLNRMGYPGDGDNAVAMFNEHVGPYVGLHIESDGSVAQVPISQGPHTGNTMEQVLTE